LHLPARNLDFKEKSDDYKKEKKYRIYPSSSHLITDVFALLCLNLQSAHKMWGGYLL